MLLAVEGGGFFSSSVSGCSSSLTLLLLGQKSEDKPMRVLPLLVDREPDLNIQLASTKTWISWRCASPSFRCFRQNPAVTNSSPLKKAATTQRQDSLRASPRSDNGKNNHVPSSDDDNLARKMVLKSSLKKASDAPIVSVPNADGNEALGGKGSCDPSHVERRKVQWTDTCGSELAEVKEFEPRYGNFFTFLFFSNPIL